MKNIVLDFFGFSQIPFSKLLSPKQLFHSQDYKEAFAQLEYGIPVEDIMLLSGPIGCGKSAVLNALIHSLDPNRYSPIYMRGNSLSEAELYKAILVGLRPPAPLLLRGLQTVVLQAHSRAFPKACNLCR